MKPPKKLSEALRGQTVYELGSIEALWVPSARLIGASNLVVFPERLQAGSSLTLYDPDRLLSVWVVGS